MSTVTAAERAQREAARTREALQLWFQRKLRDSHARIVEMRRLTGGLMNETHFVCVSSGSNAMPYVVRWDPGEGVMAPYDMALQFNVFRALAQTTVPTPRAYWLELDHTILGRDFWVLEFVEGDTPGRLLDRAAPHYAERLNSYVGALAAIHRADWRALSLDRILGVPDARPGVTAIAALERFRAQVRDVTDQALFARAHDWLSAHAPQSWRLALTHGDCSLSNYLYRGGSVVAVLDWEMASLSDPLQDVGFFCNLVHRYRREESERERQRERAAFLEAYQGKTGCDYGTLPFWEALTCYRSAVMSAHPAYAAYATSDYKDRLQTLIA